MFSPPPTRVSTGVAASSMAASRWLRPPSAPSRSASVIERFEAATRPAAHLQSLRKQLVADEARGWRQPDPARPAPTGPVDLSLVADLEHPGRFVCDEDRVAHLAA